MPLVESIVKGIIALIKRSNEKSNPVAYLTKSFASVENFPLESIPKIMAAKTTKEKASYLFYTLFKSSNFEATEEQLKSIESFLKV